MSLTPIQLPPMIVARMQGTTCIHCGLTITHGGTPALEAAPQWFDDGDDFSCPDGEQEHRPKCAWFALCENEATTKRSHPILGDVPICDRCDKKVEALST